MKVFFQRHITFFLLIFGLVLLAACSDSSEPATGNVEEINVTPSSLVVSGIDFTYDLTVTATLKDGQQSNTLSGVVWSSSDNTLATVDATGTVTVHALGKVSIYANYYGLLDEVNLEIVEISSLELFPKKLEVTALDETFSLNVKATDDQGREVLTLGDFSWASSNELVISSSGSGDVTSHAVGNASIYVSYDNLTAESQISVDQSARLIEGAAHYEDKLYTTDGFSGSDSKVIRYASVELLDENNEVFAVTSTDENGAYNFGYVVPDKFSIRLLAQVNDSPAPGFSVNDLQRSLYSFVKSSQVDNTGQTVLQYPFVLDQNQPGAAAFNLLDVVTSAAQYSQQVLNINVSDLKIYWEKGADIAGTYYCTEYDTYDCQNDKGIYILSQEASFLNANTPDTDEFDDDVIMHEFAHFITENYSVDDSQGGIHYIDQNDSDLRLSWSEGWGTFFPSAVKYWLQSQNPDLLSSQSAVTTYVDTIGNQSYMFYDISSSEMQDGFYYASSEAAVSRILWHILENYGMPKIWDVLINYFPVSGKPTSLPVFWDGLLSSDLYASSELPQLESIFAERRVYYQLDDSESDNTLTNATVQNVGDVPVVTNTLYNDELVGDVDFVAFQAQTGKTYRITTIDLYNGIDTAIRLLNEQGDVLAENDDADPNAYNKFDYDVGAYRISNSPTAMASKVEFTATETAKYYIEVKFADKKSSTYDFVGHYGSYKVSIVEVP